jgi:hypothetical protein
MSAHSSLRTTSVLAAMGLTALICSSCTRGESLYPVRGQVFFDGQPATGALVVLHPADDNSPEATRPSGYVDATGTVKLASYLMSSRSFGDGAPAGEYIVTVLWLPPNVKEYSSKHPNSELPDKLQGRYSQPGNSTLRAKVLEQPTELPRIDLKKEGAVPSGTRPSISHLSPHCSNLRFDPRCGGPIHA